MADENGDNQPQLPDHEPELLPAMMAIVLAVVAQLALQDGLTLLGLAGYVVAAWLFVASTRGLLEGFLGPAAAEAPQPEPEAAGAPPGRSAPAAGRLAYLRHNWRLVTLAEIFRGDIPPARLGSQELSTPTQAEPNDEPEAEIAPAASAPRAIKVTPQGEVLVLDTGLAQVQRFGAGGQLLATYSLATLAGLEIVDLDVSPDGRTLYVVDASSKRLHVITLADDEPGGEEE
jgi:DNA-binding beta-propeller fold protein YncE